MSAPHADQLVEGYLARLNAAAGDLPKSARQELVDDMRAHIAEARAREPEETDATILNILDRLGEPAVVVAEARERLGIRPSPPYRPGFLEVATVILVPFLWPIGVILLWMSPAWHWQDKLIGTLVPPGGYLGLGIILAAGAGISNRSCTTAIDQAGRVVQNSCSGGGELPQVFSALLAILIFGSPLFSAAYLAVRLRWGRRLQVAVG
ncbi:MAG TPA: hypothetical protein VGR77_10930 [Candidatus Dormibacteraeota bacterium]|nr:hypothetical protein [Candidatus Dormibacteraeota bacterium]